MKQLIMLTAILAVSACAKKPEEISAADVGDGIYRGLTCSQLATRRTQHNQNLENLSADQRSAAQGDALGVFLLGLPLSSMSGNDKETAIAVTKGHLQQIETEQQRKACRA